MVKILCFLRDHITKKTIYQKLSVQTASTQQKFALFVQNPLNDRQVFKEYFQPYNYQN